MSASDTLDQLAGLAGIEDGWWDFYGQWRPVTAETKKVFLAAMGFAVATDQDVARSLAELDQRPWRRWLEPVSVLEQGGDDWVGLTMPAACDQAMLDWTLLCEDGVTRSGQARVDTLWWIGERWLDGRLVKRWRLPLGGDLPLGYHSLEVAVDGGTPVQALVAVAPVRAFEPEALKTGAWGVATQIYALRDDDDWGMGTYGGLARLAGHAARLGAAAVGVNPLHALFPAQPEKFSPYAPSSRRFLNTAYIDVEAIPEFSECQKARRSFVSPGFQANLARLRAQDLVEYVDVARLTAPILDDLYAWFRDTHLAEGDARGQAFRTFQAAGGDEARRFCLFQALHEHFTRDGNSYWRQWPDGFRDPSSVQVAEFAAARADRIQFFWWLQFVADQQLAAAQAAAHEGGAAIGLYRDLGVGIAGDGADAWANQGQLALGVSVGAPPDPLALKGQNWGLLPFNPIAMRESGYTTFIQILRANMRHAGAMRLDHAMLLARLYWVPPGVDADQGAYVRYPVEDLFRLLALESVRARCMVIGEDLGTVPDGFRPRMDRSAIYAYRVMVFEKDGPVFKAPDRFDAQALAIFATHDLPSVRGWWDGIDIDSRRRLDLFPRPDMAAAEQQDRSLARAALVAALAAQGLIAADFPVHAGLNDDQARALAEACHLYLARSASRLMMVQVEDVLGLSMQMNLPGTTDQHPNWRHRFPVDVDAFAADDALVRLAAALRRQRPGQAETA